MSVPVAAMLPGDFGKDYHPRWGEPSEKVIFDDDGDLRLIVGPDKVSFIVCSKALARASKIFKHMLFGGFAESKPADNAEWVVELPEDDVNGMHILMDIVHGNIDKVPTDIYDNPGTMIDMSVHDRGNFFKTDYDVSAIVRGVAVAADKYDLVHVLHPWANAWLEDACRKYHRLDIYHAHWHKWRENVIWSAWALGDELLLNLELNHVVRTARLGKPGSKEQDEEDSTVVADGDGDDDMISEDEENEENDDVIPTGDENGDIISDAEANDDIISEYLYEDDDDVLIAYDVDGNVTDLGLSRKLANMRMGFAEQIATARRNLLASMLKPVKTLHDLLVAHQCTCRPTGREILVSDLLFELFLDDDIDIRDNAYLKDFKGTIGEFHLLVLNVLGKIKQPLPFLNFGETIQKVEAAYAFQFRAGPLISLSDVQVTRLERQRQKSKVASYWIH
ncbi:hypothetical protein CONLIGDRAFT_644067 [Coniochaeta ligniaria NRRL 30616]|uniref:BTB domain-containing protein n=1 Tax=Coniochaeta ligniaria NRRL 30616 TaxID=1408157 RepID=A0A1J7IRR3_9PEZI|nr:hypothetical protein CONLIGDRAFT_644067 [Coniochaeta ligniaria NRRL 30616]